MKKANTTGGKILSGALALSIAAISVKIIGVLYKVPLSYILGDEGMGYFNSAYAVYGFFYILCTAGVPKAVTVLITEAKERTDSLAGEKILKITLRVFFLIGLFFTLLLVTLSGPICALVGNSPSKASLLAIAPSLLFVSLSGVMRGYHNAEGGLGAVAVAEVIEAISKLGLGLLFAVLAERLMLPLPICAALSVLGISFGSFFGAVYLYLVIILKNKNEKAGQKCAINTKGLIRRFFKIAIPVSVSSSVLSLSGIIDLALIMRGLKGAGYSEASASAIFGNYTTLVTPMLNLVAAVLGPVSLAALPVLASFVVSNRREEFKDTLIGTVRVLAFVSVPAMLAFLLYGYTALDLLFSDSAALSAAPLLALISPAAVLLPLLSLLNTSLEASGNFRTPVISLIVGGVVKIFFSALPIFIVGIGITSAPLGTVFSYFASLCISYGALRRAGLANGIFTAYLRVFVAAALAFGIPHVVFYSLEILPFGRLGAYIPAFSCAVLYVIFNIREILRMKKNVINC